MTLVILSLILLLIIWICWPWAGVAVGRRWLPRTWSGRDGAFTLSTVAAMPLPDTPATQARLTIPVQRIRALTAELTGWRIPSGGLRGGVAAAGTFAWNELGPGPRPWQAQAVWSGSRPGLAAVLPVADVNRLIAYRLALMPDSPVIRAVVSRARLVDADEPASTMDTRRFAIEAAGEVTWRYLGMENTVAIRRCTAWLHLRFDRVPGGLHPVARLTIDELDTPVLDIPLLGQVRRLIVPVIEQAVDRSLAQRLDGVVMPAWAPTDIKAMITTR